MLDYRSLRLLVDTTFYWSVRLLGQLLPGDFQALNFRDWNEGMSKFSGDDWSDS